MFFKSIEPHLVGMNLNLVISKSETGLVVSVLPQLTCKDEAKKNITPILLKGTAEELDAQFAGIIQEPLQKVSGLSTNLIQFEKSVEKSEAENAITKSKKDEVKKLTDKADKDLVQAEEAIKKEDIPKAIELIEKALKTAPDYKKAKDMLTKHKKSTSDTPDMFEIVEEVPIVEVKEVVPEAVKIVPSVLPETPVISIAKQEKVEAMLVEEEAIGRENEVSQADKDNKPVSLKGAPKPRRIDNEPMEEFEIRVAAWKVYNPEVKVSQDDRIKLVVEANVKLDEAITNIKSKDFDKAMELVDEALAIVPDFERAISAKAKVTELQTQFLQENPLTVEDANERLEAFEAESPTVVVEEEVSEMQEMTEQEVADREYEKLVSETKKVEVASTPESGADDDKYDEIF